MIRSPVSLKEGGATPSFRVRPGRRGDAGAISTLLSELGFPDSADSSTVAWVISHPEMEIIVAGDAQDRPIGVLTLSHRPQLRMKGRLATIDELVVNHAWRRKGVGRALVRKAIDRAKVLSVKRLELHVTVAEGQSEEKFYEACGFRKVNTSIFRLTEVDFEKA